jgi:hypothetical protein
MAITNVFAGIATADYDSALPWYERLLGRPPDLIPNENEAAWQMAETAWMYLVADADGAGKALLTLLVRLHGSGGRCGRLAEIAGRQQAPVVAELARVSLEHHFPV